MAEPATPQPSTETVNPAVLSPQEMTDGQLQEFMAKGTRFERDAEPSPADKTSESAPDKPVDQAASTDASTGTASETVKPEKTKGKGLKARVDQLKEENETLSAELRRRRELNEQIAAEDARSKPKQDATTDPSPAATAKPKEADWKRFKDLPDAPKSEDFTGETALEDYLDARAGFIAGHLAKEQFEQMFTERQNASHAESEHARELHDAITVAEARAAKDEARDPEWTTKLDPGFARIPPLRLLDKGQQPNAMHFIKDQVMFESEHPCSLSVFLCTEEGKAWAAQLVRMQPARIVRDIAIKDASFASQDDDESIPSHVSAAPPPGQTLGRKPAAPVDPLKSAQDKGDAEAWINLRNKQLVGK